MIYKAQTGMWVPPINPQEAEQLARNTKEDTEYWVTHDFKTKKDERARQFASGLSALGIGMQYANPTAAVVGGVLQVPDALYDLADWGRSVALHGFWSPEAVNNGFHLFLDIPAVAIAQRIPGVNSAIRGFQRALEKGKADEIASTISALDDSFQAAGIDVLDFFKHSPTSNNKLQHVEQPSATYVKKPLIPIKRKQRRGNITINNNRVQ